MRLTILGCSGSVVGPDSPASGYLLTAPDTAPIVIDFGGGVLGALQRHADPGDVNVLLSHLHADHCLDLPGLFVWRRYHPTPPVGRALLYDIQGSTDNVRLYNADGSFKPLAELEAMAKKAVGDDKDKEILLYCDSGRVASVWWYLLSESFGYKNVKLYDGSVQDFAKDASTPLEP